MTTQPRRYDDPCGTARALDVIGERWALLVVRELIFGPKRFTDLHAGLRGISRNVLSQRLRELTHSGVVRRIELAPPAGQAYELTARGAALEPILLELGRWGSRVPLDPDGGAELGTDALMLALKTTFDARRAGSLDASIQLVLGPNRFRARVSAGTAVIERGTETEPAATITGSSAALRSVIFGGRRLADAARAGDLAVTGSRRLAERFVRCFPRPEPFPPPATVDG